MDLARDENPRQLLEHRDVWETALKKIESGEMPPSDAKKLPDDQRELVVKFLTQTLNELHCDEGIKPGHPVLRRLNRTEYDLTILDLTGLDLRLAETFAPDPTGYGFDNIGDILTLSPVQVEQFHEAAKKIVAAIRASRESKPEVYRRVFAIEGLSGEEPTAAKQILQRFAERAFRRPVEPAYLDRVMQIYALARKKGESHEDGVAHLLTTVLISPRFLMRIENDHSDTDEPYLVDNYEMASRLSYFLWSRPPDEALLQAAEKGDLVQEEGLKRETLRMLKDSRVSALADHFFGQWLGFRELANHRPDVKTFPEYNAELQEAILGEVRYLLRDVIQNDQPITHLLDANYTYANERLAQWYGIEGVKGKNFQKVNLNDHKRGGLITSAALLMLQSDPTRTNVPRRGNFLAGQILGAPPPPPPPDVPPLDSVADGKKRSLREMLELHRSKPDCAGCHAKIDPLGFSLENYDALGRWRDEDDGFPIHPESKTEDGRVLKNAADLKTYLMDHRSAFRRVMAKNLLIYALGRGLRGDDECMVRDIIRATEEKDDKFSAMVIAIVMTDAFRYRQNPDD